MDQTSSLQRLARLLLVLVFTLLGSGIAFAHAKLVGEDPAAQSTVASPGKIQLHFSEDLAKNFSSFKLTDSNGTAVALSGSDAADAKSLAAVPKGALAPGTYTVSWTAVASDDGHKSSGSFVFTVR